MPVEIKELVIRAVVEPSGGAPHGESPGGVAGCPEAADPQELVAASVREVLRILRRTRQR